MANLGRHRQAADRNAYKRSKEVLLFISYRRPSNSASIIIARADDRSVAA